MVNRLLLLSLFLSAVSPQDFPYPLTLKRRAFPNQSGNSPFPTDLFDPAASNRSLDPLKANSPSTTPSPTDPAVAPAAASASPSPTSPSPPPTPKDTTLSDSILPLLGSPPPSASSASPTSSPTPTNSIHPSTPTSSNLAPSSTSPSPSPTPTPPAPSRGQSSTTDPSSTSTTSSTSPNPSPESQTNIRTTKPPPPRKSDDSKSSGLGATTIKLMGIIAAVIVGLFLLWTIIRKWKFRPSKRFAKKLDECDEDVFAPRPPSFGEKRGKDYQAYSIPSAPNGVSAFGSQYPAYPDRSASPSQKAPYGNDPHGSHGYQAHQLSHVTITQPPMLEQSPYRLSLGLGNPPHAYPPSDQPKPTVM